jgi:cbb3-type cytochrome oxidase subunit 3
MVSARFIVLCGWLLPLLAVADVASGVSLRLVEGRYRPGDVIELHAEMRRAEYAEFELHVPAHQQLHFVAHTRTPVRYVGGEYVQSVLLLLQPMTVGEFELTGITATLLEGELATELPLPPLQLTVESYATEDASQALAEFGEDASVAAKTSNLIGVVVVVLILLLLVVWLLVRNGKAKVEEVAGTEIDLNDLISVLEGNAPAMSLIEQLLERRDLTLSPAVREALEAAAYANRLDSAALLRRLKEEGAR